MKFYLELKSKGHGGIFLRNLFLRVVINYIYMDST